jgi:hypothetical protein
VLAAKAVEVVAIHLVVATGQEITHGRSERISHVTFIEEKETEGN